MYQGYISSGTNIRLNSPISVTTSFSVLPEFFVVWLYANATFFCSNICKACWCCTSTIDSNCLIALLGTRVMIARRNQAGPKEGVSFAHVFRFHLPILYNVGMMGRRITSENSAGLDVSIVQSVRVRAKGNPTSNSQEMLDCLAVFAIHPTQRLKIVSHATLTYHSIFVNI